MNKRILLSSMSILASAALIAGATFAFFSDSETSSGNTFKAGSIDLEIDNTSYYNGEANPATTWGLKDITNELFFDFRDIKPGDIGEDTVSLHVSDNNSWACVDIDITANDDNGLTDPEEQDGDTTPGSGQGELAQALEFIFWEDDGDNVLETGETVLTQGTADAVLGGVTYALADTNGSIFDNANDDGSLDPAITYFIGKAWCFGNLEQDPVAAGDGNSPTKNPGVTCDGSTMNNTTQTDSIMGDITFRAVQTRNNDTFVCERPS